MGRFIRTARAGGDPGMALTLGKGGGGQGTFIGAVHRMAARLDGRRELVAGALSPDPARSAASSFYAI